MMLSQLFSFASRIKNIYLRNGNTRILSAARMRTDYCLFFFYTKSREDITFAEKIQLLVHIMQLECSGIFPCPFPFLKSDTNDCRHVEEACETAYSNDEKRDGREIEEEEIAKSVYYHVFLLLWLGKWWVIVTQLITLIIIRLFVFHIIIIFQKHSCRELQDLYFAFCCESLSQY